MGKLTQTFDAPPQNCTTFKTRIVFSYISFWYYINRFDAADYSASAFVCRRHHGGCWSCKAIECFLMWKLYMCDIEGRDVELAAWNLSHELQTNNSSISIGISFLKQRSTVCPLGIWKRSLRGGKAVGEGNRAFPRGGSCGPEEDAFSVFLLSQKDFPPLHHFYSYYHFYTFVWSGSSKSASAAAVLHHRVNRAASSMHCFF